jgi:hypothetical protein
MTTFDRALGAGRDARALRRITPVSRQELAFALDGARASLGALIFTR